MKKPILYLFLLFVSATLTACVSTQGITPDNKRNIHNVAIDKNVTLKSDMYYLGPGLGYVGPILGSVAGMSAEEKIKKLASVNNIKIQDIVSQELEKGLHSIHRLKLVEKSKADGIFKIDVQVYGFSIPQGFSFQVVPILTLDVKLIKGNKVVWKNYYRVDPLFGGMKSYKVSELETNPKAIENAWDKAAAKAVNNILLTLN